MLPADGSRLFGVVSGDAPLSSLSANSRSFASWWIVVGAVGAVDAPGVGATPADLGVPAATVVVDLDDDPASASGGMAVAVTVDAGTTCVAVVVATPAAVVAAVSSHHHRSDPDAVLAVVQTKPSAQILSCVQSVHVP